MTTKSYLSFDVMEAARRRLRWIFERFPDVAVNVSGGKDSTVVLELTLEIAAEYDRLPLRVLFIDQEAEWNVVIEHMREIRERPEVQLDWLQCPIRIANATSPWKDWLYCWEEGVEWMREKEPDSIHENTFGTVTFAQLFGAWQGQAFPDGPSCLIAGVRAQESPARRLGLVTYETMEGETWGRIEDRKRGMYTWYPIYDWLIADVWKAIHANGWSYCPIYDWFYQYGISPAKMRVSNLHHGAAVRDLFLLQELEPDTWAALTARLDGVNTAGHLQWDMFVPKELPPGFRDWVEYRDWLLEHLVVDDKIRESMRGQFAAADSHFRHDPKVFRELLHTEISAILVHDYFGTKMETFYASHIGQSINSGTKGSKREWDKILKRQRKPSATS